MTVFDNASLEIVFLRRDSAIVVCHGGLEIEV